MYTDRGVVENSKIRLMVRRIGGYRPIGVSPGNSDEIMSLGEPDHGEIWGGVEV